MSRVAPTSACAESCKTLLPSRLVEVVEEALHLLVINNTRPFAQQAPIKTVLSVLCLVVGVVLAHLAIFKRQCRTSTDEDKTTIVSALVLLFVGFEATIANLRIIFTRYDLAVGEAMLQTVSDPLIGMLLLFVGYRSVVHRLPTCSHPALERLDGVLFQTLLAVPPVLQYLRVVIDACESDVTTGVTMALSMGLIVLLFLSHQKVLRGAQSPVARTRVVGVLFSVYVVLQRFLTFQQHFIKYVKTARQPSIHYEPTVGKFQLNNLVRDSTNDNALLEEQYTKLWNVFDNRSERGSKIVYYIRTGGHTAVVLTSEGQAWLNGLPDKNKTIGQWWHSILPDPKDEATFRDHNRRNLVLLATVMVREQNAVNNVLFWKLLLDWVESHNRDANNPFVRAEFRTQDKEARNEWYQSHRLSTRFEPNDQQQRQFRRFLVDHVICKSTATQDNPVLTEYLEKDVSVPGLAQLLIITNNDDLRGISEARRGSIIPQEVFDTTLKSMETDDDSTTSCAKLLWLWNLCVSVVVAVPAASLAFLLWKRSNVVQDYPVVLCATLAWAVVSDMMMRAMTHMTEQQSVSVESEE